MKLLKRLKRPLTFLLAISLFITSLSISGGAAQEDLVQLCPDRVVFRGKSLNAFGKTHHDMNIYQVGRGESRPPALCIQEGKKLPDDSPATYEHYEAKPGQTIPVIGSFERFLAMSLAYEWLMLEGPFLYPERYGVAQVYYWGCMAGYEHNWPMQEQAMVKLSGVMNSPGVMTYYQEMKDYIIQGEADYNGTSNSALPSWSGSTQKMTLKDGHYELTLDISMCPQLKDTVWTFPDGSWSYQLSTDGNSITFTYNGAAEPEGEVISAELSGIESRHSAYLYTPAASSELQMQFGWLENEYPTAKVSFSVSDVPIPTPDTPSWEIYRHSETFESNYNIDLEKYCAETNQSLEAATFNVWEDFDFSQVNREDYVEGSPDGSAGEVYLNRMSPEPRQDYLCDTITTDGMGHAGHSDVRNYNYSKLYCMGHPAPEWIECDHDGGDGEEGEECSCDEENERLREQWLAEQELCAATCDFHAGNTDEENRERDASAMEAMLVDRDETYEKFINLEYSYTLQEKNARPGYTLHGKHNDDKPIETVILTSAQAGGSVMAGNYRSASAYGRVADRIYKMADQMMEQRLYRYALPEGQELELEEQRSVVHTVKEAEEDPLPGVPKKNDAETGENESGDIGSGGNASGDANTGGNESAGAGSGGNASGGDNTGGNESGDTGSGGNVSGDTNTGGNESGDTGSGGNASGDTNTGGNESGNAGSGGNASGGDNTGGNESGDTGSGGNASGDANTGGNESGDTGSGGKASGDTNTGGNESGDTGSGGKASGDTNTGGNESAGAGSGGKASGGDNTGGNESGDTGSGGKASGDTNTGGNESGDTGSGGKASGHTNRGGNTSGNANTGGNGTGSAISQRSSRARLPLSAPAATGNEAGKENGAEEDWEGTDPEDEEEGEAVEEYRYSRTPLYPSFDREIIFEAREPDRGEGNAIARFFAAFFSEGEEPGGVSGSLPAILDDSLTPMDGAGYGDPYENIYTFKVWDHRTEGRIHINKRDLELFREDPDGSYGQAQGDGTLEGAVYGLFAAQDILHPDGKSGVIYNQNNLVAVAATDRNGDASFLACTEKPGTSLDRDGNIAPPDGDTGPENLYDGSSVTSSGEGFGTIAYPDYRTENGNQWIGRPLLMGSYYIMELSRSEGYELSVKGLNLTETNRAPDGAATIRESGAASVSGGLSDYNSMAADGSWNDFMVDRYKTVNGYDIVVTGYPEGTRFFRIEMQSVTGTVKDVTGSSLEPKKDEHGNIVYQTAKGGEYKTDSKGNPIIKADTATGSGADQRIPYGETLFYRFRTAPYPRGSGTPGDLSKWSQAIDGPYLETQVNRMLGQIGYKEAEGPDGAPWADIELTGATNAQAATEILDWFTRHNFFDCGTVESVFQDGGTYYARVFYDYSLGNDGYPAVYDSINRQLYVRKTVQVQGGPAGEAHYWITYENAEFSLSGRTVTVKEKRAIDGAVAYGDSIESRIETVYQPVYETYAAGEPLVDAGGMPIPVLERVYTYTDHEITYDKEVLKAIAAVYDSGKGTYTIHVDNDRDWTGESGAVTDAFRAVTSRKTIEHEGQAMLYSQYLTDIAGAGVTAYAAIPALDAGSYIKTQQLVYPGQNQAVQDAGTQAEPVQALQRSIKQSIQITKDISQASYDDVNTYGSVHNDPLTALLGLFTGGGSAQGAKTLNQFKFKLYLKSNLENIYVDETGAIVSEEIGSADFKGDAQRVFLPPKDGLGRRLLEYREDGTCNYTKFFDAMDSADKKKGGSYPQDTLRQFAIAYYEVDGYKKEILEAQPELNSDAAYDMALERAKTEAAAYLDIFQGLNARLSIAWDSDAGGGPDGDPTTLQCNARNGKDGYYNNSIPLPYGTYVIVEQTPADTGKELANRHYTKDCPKEVSLPFVPDIREDGNTGDTEVNSQTGSPYYRYDSTDTPEDLIRKYKIRFNEETHIIQAHSNDGDFEIFKYGLDKDARPGHSLTSSEPRETEYMDGGNHRVKGYYIGYASQSEDAGTMDGVVYNGYETDSGQLEVRDGVPAMTGVQTAIEGKFAPMLVPWTVLAPAVDRVNPDTGNVETLAPSGSGADFNFAAFAHEDFEDAYYRSKLRIEKLDAETGDNIIHEGALFKIYAAKRDLIKNGVNSVEGTGGVLFGEAVDWEGNPVTDANGTPVLYPRVGQDNGSPSDLPVRLDKEGIPQYEESQLIRQEDGEGNETGIFKAYSTVREVVEDGQVKKEAVGYIETYKPLGAGAYVLVEIQAPEGYAKSRPVAFEVYADDVTYYEEQRNTDGTTEGWEPVTAARYQYAAPVSGETNKFRTETVSQIKVQDYPSRMEIHKVEDGDSLTGNKNGLRKTDAQGKTELSGGFDTAITVNDKGDLLAYEVRGRKEKLEERGDVRDIAYSPENKDWYGYVTKPMDECSERIVEGTETALKAMPNVKPLYERDGTFTGKGIDFAVSVSDAKLSLYKAIEIEKTGENQYKGVTAAVEDGKVTGITSANTGTRKEIVITGKDSGPAGLDEWDSKEADKEPVNLFFYDLDTVDTEKEPDTGELAVLDSRGNRICYADSKTGMAYVYDDYGRMLAYTVDEAGHKELARSIQVTGNGTAATIYEGKTTVDDEQGLPIHYTGGTVTTKDETWITDDSTDPYGNPETSGGAHTITRLPFGAYILQEEAVPYDQGYIQAEYLGLVLEDRPEIQKYFLQNQFTRIAIAKVDVRTQKEIEGAELTLYKARLDADGSPETEKDGTYKKGEPYTTWFSGYACDDNGNRKTGASGEPIPTAEPHWIDHIPVGYYVLEETSCPYEQGYVQARAVNLYVSETGDVQSFAMEDDFTALDVWKYDTKNEDTLYKDSDAYLTLYQARLDDAGEPALADGIPQYEESGKIFTFRAATYKDGQDVAATGRVEPDAGGNNPIIKYDYDIKPIPNTLQGRHYYTEKGTVRLEYLPVGSYVLVETGNPEGYATAEPALITIRDTGHLEEIQQAEMGDKPLKLEVSKVNAAGGKEVNGAQLAIYPVDESGTVSDTPLVLRQPTAEGQYQDVTAQWTSGLDGRYTKEEEQAGQIPGGFKAGDLKPHLIEYIPEGDYILREETTPYGFLQSVDIPFTVIDSRTVQTVEMIDGIPEGILKLIKSDTDRPDEKLKDVQFRLTNKTLNKVCETVTTNARGEGQFKAQPIGFMDKDGNFKAYTYECREIKAAEGHMLTLKPYEFQFQYENERTDTVTEEYNPSNDSNRVKTDKQLGDTGAWLEGVTLRIERKTEGDKWETVDEWVTGRQTHCTKDLKAGEYRLREIKAPEGFKALAEPMGFTITDGMTEIPQLTMKNYASIVEIQKTKGSGNFLAGARLQLLHKETGAVIGEWTSEEGAGRKFYGLEAGVYLIRELEAPVGYKKGEDREITVTEDDSRVQVFKYENKTKGGGGGGGDKPKPRAEYIAFKKTDGAGKALPGAEFTFYDQLGNVMGTSVSDRQGQFRIRKPENGTYTFRETKAPEGYGLNPQIYSFTVGDGIVFRGVYEVVNKKLEVPLKKIDAFTGEFLPGARLNIRARGDSEKIISEAVTKQDGILIFEVPHPGVYHIRESEAPQGYQLTEDVYEVTVSEDGQVSGNTRIYNYKETLPVKTMGRITAVYRVKGRFGKGTYGFGGGRDSSVRTGDHSPLIQTAVAGMLCLAGFIICVRWDLRRKGKKRKNNSDAGRGKGGGKKLKIIIKSRSIWIVLSACMATGILDSTEAAAMETELIQTVEPLDEPADSFYVSGQITYKAVEAVELIPQRAWITARDSRSGARREVVLPLSDYTFINERWADGFQMQVKITGYGSDTYLIGERLVMQETKFSDYEEELLALAGLGSESYHIEGARWDGEIYEEKGEKCRNLEVFGKKLVRDCVATYSGMVNRLVFKGESTAEVQAEGEIIAGSGGNMINWQSALLAVLAIAAAAGIFFCNRKFGFRLPLKPAAIIFLTGTICCAAFLTRAAFIYGKGKKTYREIARGAFMTEEKLLENEPKSAPGDTSRQRLGESWENEPKPAPEDTSRQTPGKASENTPENALTQAQKNIAQSGQNPKEPLAPFVNESWLKKINPDYRMWVSIPGTGINYPIVQYVDNQYYLNHNFYKEEHIGGCIFLDSSIQPLITDNTILYGHNMKDGSMFGTLKKYRDEAFYLEHPVVSIFYGGRWTNCPVFSCQLRSETDADPYRKDLLDTEWLPYLEEMRAASLYYINYPFTGGERIITLSTCYGSSQRLVIQAAMPDYTKER